MGIETIFYTKIVDQFTHDNNKIKYFRAKRPSQLGASLLVGFFAYQWVKNRCSSVFNNYWQEIGYYYTGPLAYSFARFVEKEAREDNIHQLLFIARSGYILQKIFKIINSDIQTEYIYASRILKILCFLQFDTHIEYEKLVQRFIQKDKELYRKFLVLKRTSKEDYKQFFIDNKSHFEKIAAKNADIYNKYLHKLIKSRNIGIVDDSANSFSAQSNIEKILNKKIMGFYISVLDRNFANLFSYKAFHETVNKKVASIRDVNLRTWCWFFVEFLLSAPEPPINDVNRDGFVFSFKDEFEIERSKTSGHLCLGAECFAKEMKTIFGNHDLFLDYYSAIEWINSFLLNPTEKDYSLWKSVKFDWYAFNNDHHDFLVRDRFRYKLICKHIPPLIESNFYWDLTRGILYDYDLRNGKKNLKVLGLTIYSKKLKNKIWKEKYLGGIVKIKKSKEYKKIYFLGIKIHKKDFSKKILAEQQKNVLLKLNRIIQTNISTALLHQKTFLPFKCKHLNQDIFIMSAAPSVVYVNEDALKGVKIGVNLAILRFNQLDYLFIQDYLVNKDKMELLNDYVGNNCIKFYGLTMEYNKIVNRVIPESSAILAGALRYRTDWAPIPNFSCEFAYDIASKPLGCFGSIMFPAIQFALWTSPKRIFLVGADCSSGYFYGGDTHSQKHLIERWKKFKVFANTYYPETEIISINPVGLKGMFRDVYTKEYLHKHPEIDETTVEILNVENKD